MTTRQKVPITCENCGHINYPICDKCGRKIEGDNVTLAAKLGDKTYWRCRHCRLASQRSYDTKKRRDAGVPERTRKTPPMVNGGAYYHGID